MGLAILGFSCAPARCKGHIEQPQSLSNWVLHLVRADLDLPLRLLRPPVCDSRGASGLLNQGQALLATAGALQPLHRKTCHWQLAP